MAKKKSRLGEMTGGNGTLISKLFRNEDYETHQSGAQGSAGSPIVYNGTRMRTQSPNVGTRTFNGETMDATHRDSNGNLVMSNVSRDILRAQAQGATNYRMDPNSPYFDRSRYVAGFAGQVRALATAKG